MFWEFLFLRIVQSSKLSFPPYSFILIKFECGDKYCAFVCRISGKINLFPFRLCHPALSRIAFLGGFWPFYTLWWYFLYATTVVYFISSTLAVICWFCVFVFSRLFQGPPMANDTNSVDALLQAAQFLEAANDGKSFPECDNLG